MKTFNADKVTNSHLHVFRNNEKGQVVVMGLIDTLGQEDLIQDLEMKLYVLFDKV